MTADQLNKLALESINSYDAIKQVHDKLLPQHRTAENIKSIIEFATKIAVDLDSLILSDGSIKKIR